MSATPVSNPTAFMTVAQFLQRKDARVIGDLAGDVGTRIDPVTLQTPGNPYYQRVADAISDASGEIESACSVAGKYSPLDLSTLTGNSLSYLQKLTADLAIVNLLEKSPQPDRPMPPECVEAKATLEKLRLGERIFGFQENMDAGDPQSRIQDLFKRQTLNLATYQARRMFGCRAEDNRPYMGG